VRRALFLSILLALFCSCYGGARPPRIGTQAPDFTAQDSDKKISLTDLRGKVVVLNFWATWCPPCVEEMPSLIQMSQKLQDKGVVVLGVSVDVDQDAYRKFLAEHKVSFLTVRDGDHKVPDLYGTFRWPETYIIGRDGIVRRKFIGPVDWNSPEVVDFLTKL
jgi:cytochrome c biogenesis protein CcmG, thiol:disulfide interchange protein DsbE